MAWFYLNLRRGNDDVPNDPEPQEFPDLEAARAEAIESLRELRALATKEKRRIDYDGIDILAEDGRLLLNVSTSEAIKPTCK
jgi:hypothetical protein